MSGLPTDLYVALRTAPRTLVKRYASSGTALASDEATREMVAIIMKVLDNYTIEPKALPSTPDQKALQSKIGDLSLGRCVSSVRTGDIEVIEPSIEEASAMISDGRICYGKTLVLLQCIAIYLFPGD